ncbi:hypothetical protein [Phenylobacterium sp.]|jgi:hypothetical protein|uniref:phage fiber-tail adaptor protein n=1 Tax=Phenylobacterium sp. TaxID=1871053 RepID=UPI002F424B9E
MATPKIVQGFQAPDGASLSQGLPWIQKDPDDTKDYRRDWSAFLDGANSEHIASVLWIVQAGDWSTLTGAPADLTVGGLDHPSAHDSTTATVWLQGGAPGKIYNVTCRVTTTSAPPRIVDDSFQVRVLQR